MFICLNPCLLFDCVFKTLFVLYHKTDIYYCKKKEFVQGMFNSGTGNKGINVWGFILSCRVWKQAVVWQ